MQKNSIFLILLFVALFILPSGLHAQDPLEPEMNEDTAQTVIEPTQALVPETKTDNQGMDFKKARQEMELRRKQIQEKQKGIKLDAKMTITQKREDFKNQIKLKREENMEKRKAEKETFKAELAVIKDERKKEIVERIDAKISTLNRLRTDHLADVLDKLMTIIDKADARAVELKSEGKDTTAFEASIAAAKTAIDTAKAAVEAQASKEYVISITDETKLQTDTQTTLQMLQVDLRATATTVMQAKEAVHNVFKNYNFKI